MRIVSFIAWVVFHTRTSGKRSVAVCSVLLALLITACESVSPLPQQILQGNNTEALRTIQAGKGIDIPDAIGFTPLLYAARCGNITVAQALVSKGARVNYISPSGASPLAEATFNGLGDLVQLLLANGGDPNISSRHVFSPLHCAATKGYLTIAERLVDSGANVNAVSAFKTTPLDQAVGGGHLAIMDLLLAHGAQIDLQPPGGGDSALIIGAMNGKLLSVDHLVRHKADMEATNRYGITPLMAAATWDHATICRCLLTAGAKLAPTNRAGDNALAMAIKRNSFEAAKVLLNAGSTFQERTNSAEEIFHAAVYRKVRADKYSADTRLSEANADYRTAQAFFYSAREQFAAEAKSLEAGAKKASASAARAVFWGGLLDAVTQAAAQGAAEGLAGAATAAATESQSRQAYRNTAQDLALRDAHSPAEYSARYDAIMNAYHPPAPNIGSYSYVPSQAPAPPTGHGAASTARAEMLSSGAARLNNQVTLCDQFISEIQRYLTQ